MDDHIQGEFLAQLLRDREFKEAVLKKDENLKVILNEYRQKFPGREDEIQLAVQVLASQKFDIKDEVDEDFEKMWGELKLQVRPKEEDKTGKVLPINFKSWYVAASLLIILSVSYGLIFLNTSGVEQHYEKEIAQLEKSNPKGRKSIITLSDGTRVTLNAESTISFPEEFSDDQRIVELEGEAFFEVTHDEHRPFIVLTGNISTTVLGTSFNIRNYPEEENSYVSLATGKVLVKAINEPSDIEEVLVPGEQIVSSKDRDHFEKINYNYKEVFLWKEKVIYFDHANWNKISSTLERWYGVTISVKNLDKSVEFSGQFDNQSLENVLLSIGYTLEYAYKIDDKKVEIIF